MTDLTESIGTVLARWVGAVLRFRQLTILVVLIAAGAGAYYAVRNLGVNTDTANMISAALPWRQHFIEFRESFPVRDRNLLIVIDATTPAQADDFAAALLAQLRQAPELYGGIFLPGEGTFFERNGLLYLSVAELEALADRLATAQPLIGLLQRDFSGAAIIDVANQTLAGPSANGSVGSAALAPFHAELARSLRAARAGQGAPFAWRALIAGGESSGRRIVVLQPALDFDQLQPANAAMAEIRQIVGRLNALQSTPVTVRLTGSVAMEHEELSSVGQGAGLGALVTLAMVAIVLYAALRSLRLLLISLVTLLAGLSLTAAFAAAAVGHLNLISVAFVVLNVGLGSDYVIHVCLRQRELMAQGMPVAGALVETMRGVGASLVLCAITTAAGFYSFIPTDFEGVSELGLIAGTGVFIGLLVSITLLPALVAQLVPNEQREAKTWIDPRVFAPAIRRPRVVLAATVVVVLITFAALPWVRFDSNPIHLRDPDSESVTTLLELAADGDAPLLNLVAVVPDDDTARRWSEELKQLPSVRNVITVESLVPGDQAAKLGLLEDIALIVGPGFGELTRRSPPDIQALARALQTLERNLAERSTAAERELREAVAAFLTEIESQPPAVREQTLVSLDMQLTADLPDELRRLAAGLQAQAFGREALPEALTERWLSGARELIEIVPEEDVNDNEAAERFVESVRGVVETATGPPVVYHEASKTVVRAFQLALFYALVMVTAIIWVFLRDLQDVLLVIVPILVAAGVTAGMTVLIGMPLNYANIIALPLLVGLGVDNGIHVVHRMRTDPQAAQLFNTSTLRAVLASGLTTVASFGNLAFSAHVGTASMGKLLALGLAISMAATLIVLPAWLKVYGSRARATERSRDVVGRP
ncbi:MAG TPA: MMPL family transporter [Gammaproteobacteria bacterium]|nr:MMPL family transporter [Gammaproteobacteria bacterium]